MMMQSDGNKVLTSAEPGLTFYLPLPRPLDWLDTQNENLRFAHFLGSILFFFQIHYCKPLLGYRLMDSKQAQGRCNLVSISVLAVQSCQAAR